MSIRQKCAGMHKRMNRARCETSFLIVSAWSYRPGKGVKSHHWKMGWRGRSARHLAVQLVAGDREDTYVQHCDRHTRKQFAVQVVDGGKGEKVGNNGRGVSGGMERSEYTSASLTISRLLLFADVSQKIFPHISFVSSLFFFWLCKPQSRKFFLTRDQNGRLVRMPPVLQEMLSFSV